MMRPSFFSTGLALVTLTWAVTVPGFGQDTLAADVDSGPPVEMELEEVVVMGEKDEKPASAVTSSVAIVDMKRVEDHRIYTLADSMRQMANVQAPQFTDGGFVIRGINSEAPDAENISGNQTPMAMIYVDGVALTQGAARRGPLGMWDIAQVEVFRGPQSTLQGRNALAGAIHIHTNDPTFHWEGASRTTYGKYENGGASFDQALMFSGPINDSFAFRLAAEASEGEGQVKYPNLAAQENYRDFIHSESWNVRAKLLFQPADDDSFNAMLSYNHSYSSPAGNDVYGPNAPGAPLGLSFYDRLWLSGAPNQQMRSTHTDLASLEINKRFDNGWRLFSQTAFSRSVTNIDTVAGGFVRDDVETEWTQELRAHYESERVRAVAGFYGNLNRFKSTQISIERERLNLALFGEVDYEFLPKWHAVVGARLDYDDFSIRSIRALEATSEYTRLLPKASLRYEFTPKHSVAFTVQQGYRSGGAGMDAVNQLYTFAPSTTWNYELALRSEWLDGRLTTNLNAFYTQWSDQQVVMRDLDLATFNVSERVINAAESELGGGELEIRWQATKELGFFASGGYLTTAYKDFTYNIDPTTAAALGIPSQLNYQGYDFPESPRWTGSIGFDFHHKSGFFIAADAEATSGYYSPYLFAPAGTGIGAATSVQVPQNQVVEVGSRILFNASIGWEWKHGSITLFARNLFNENYLIGQTPNLVGGGGGVPQYDGGFLATVGAPRFIGVAVNLKF